jgi:hypothetical protein
LKLEPNLHFAELALLKHWDTQKQGLDQIVNLRRLFNYYRRVNLIMFSTLDDLRRYLGRAVPGWVIAACIENNILFLDYKVWKTREAGTLTQIILHEMVHVILGSFKGKVPIWLNEGLAQYLAGQCAITPINGNDLVDSDIYNLNYNNSQLYDCSGRIVANLINTYGLAVVISRISKVTDFREDALFGEKNIHSLQSAGIQAEKRDLSALQV